MAQHRQPALCPAFQITFSLAATKSNIGYDGLLIHENGCEGSEPYKHYCEYSEADEPWAELSHGLDTSF